MQDTPQQQPKSPTLIKSTIYDKILIGLGGFLITIGILASNKPIYLIATFGLVLTGGILVAIAPLVKLIIVKTKILTIEFNQKQKDISSIKQQKESEGISPKQKDELPDISPDIPSK